MTLGETSFNRLTLFSQTGTALYTSVSNALASICPPVTQTTSSTVCSQTSVVINKIPYEDAANGLDEGELVVSVEDSSYNVTSLRDASKFVVAAIPYMNQYADLSQ
jgi:hypothetical protein